MKAIQSHFTVFDRFIFISLVIISLSFSGCGEKEASQDQGAQTGGMPMQQAVEVDVITVSAKSVPATLETTGKTASYREVEVRAQVSGTLLKRDYVEGSIVKKGKLLFQIDPTPFQTAVDKAKAMVTQQMAAVKKAERDIERLEPLLAEKAVSQQEYDDAVSSKEQAQAGLESANAALQQAEIDLNYTNVTAPISGITGKALKEEGSLVTMGSDSLLTKIHQINPIYVNYSISDTEYLKIRRQMDEGTILVPDQGELDVQLTLSDGSVYPIMGKLNYMDTLIDSQTGTIQNRAEFSNPDSILVPNQFVRVTLKGAMRPDTILVPQRAVQQNQTGHYVYVVNSEGKVEMRIVKAGDWFDSEWIIESGLSSGDVVVVDGTIKIQPGMQVRTVPVDETSAGASN